MRSSDSVGGRALGAAFVEVEDIVGWAGLVFVVSRGYD